MYGVQPLQPRLTEDHERAAQAELDAGKGAGQLDDRWPYRPREYLEDPANEPTLRDGLDLVKLKQWRRQILYMLMRAGVVLKIPQWGIATAALLCFRFFSRRSMKRNDRFVVATACLLLAAKMEESPKHLHDVVRECRRVFLGARKVEPRNKQETDDASKFQEEVLVAERAVLYTLGFDLQLTHPYRFLVKHLTTLGLLHSAEHPEHQPHFRDFMQNTWNFTNDSFRTTLCLQYRPEKIAAAALYLANMLNIQKHQDKGDVMHMIRQQTKDPHMTFNVYFDITQPQLDDICAQILALYEDVKRTPGVSQPTAPGMPQWHVT